MKLKSTMTALAAQLLLAGAAAAQTCTPSAGPLNDASGTLNIDTCSSTDQLTSICNSSTPIGNAPDTIYSVNIVPPGLRVEVTPSNYDAYVAALQGTCSGGATCVRESDNPGVGAAGKETISFVGASPGTYFLLITSFNAVGNCGPTVVQPFPTPVSLQSFSIE
ncbi:MAG TPA: hypothetical protein VN153_04655 [Tahibacter sp.]|nr:hypothetical protein [Tahibacter sp.]